MGLTNNHLAEEAERLVNGKQMTPGIPNCLGCLIFALVGISQLGLMKSGSNSWLNATAAWSGITASAIYFTVCITNRKNRKFFESVGAVEALAEVVNKKVRLNLKN